MIKFFRRIRQRLLIENKFSKYLLYGVGEIILVVIGILIALQINNWNEAAKRTTQEVKILKELVENLRSDSLDHVENARWYDNASKSAKIVLNELEARRPWNDSMALHYGWIYLGGSANLNTSAYENLKSTGFALIRNDSIRTALTDLHSLNYTRLLKYEQQMTIDNSTHVVLPVFLKRLRMDRWWHATPLNYEALMDDHEFQEVVRWRGITMGFMKGHCLDANEKASELIVLINHELDKLESE